MGKKKGKKPLTFVVSFKDIMGDKKLSLSPRYWAKKKKLKRVV
jgi:hypothetical protein